MKMSNAREAPEDGKVAEIRCKESQPVNEGDVLVVLKCRLPQTREKSSAADLRAWASC